MGRSKKELIDLHEENGVRKSKFVGNNTLWIEWISGNQTIRLHNTDIKKRRPDGRITYNTGGWHTPTTKARLNERHFEEEKLMPDIYQHDHVWYMGNLNPKEDITFFDGITFYRGDLCLSVGDLDRSPFQLVQREGEVDDILEKEGIKENYDYLLVNSFWGEITHLFGGFGIPEDKNRLYKLK